jgi:putative oxidoreductase
MNKFWLLTLPRIVLGLVFLVGAIDGFVFITTGAHLVHPPTSEPGLQFEAALKAAGFLWPLMKTMEIIGAACLLSNRAPALGLALLAPIMAVVVLFHAFLNRQGLPLAALLVVCGALLLRCYAPRYARLFEPGSPTPTR